MNKCWHTFLVELYQSQRWSWVMNESWHTYECMLWMSHFTHMNAACKCVMPSCHTVLAKLHQSQTLILVSHTCKCGWIMSHIWIHHMNVWCHHVTHFWSSCTNRKHLRWWVTHVKTSCDRYGWVAYHNSIRHVTRMKELCYIDELVMSHRGMGHVTQLSATCHMYEWAMPHRWMRRAPSRNALCHPHKRVV